MLDLYLNLYRHVHIPYMMLGILIFSDKKRERESIFWIFPLQDKKNNKTRNTHTVRHIRSHASLFRVQSVIYRTLVQMITTFFTAITIVTRQFHLSVTTIWNTHTQTYSEEQQLRLIERYMVFMCMCSAVLIGCKCNRRGRNDKVTGNACVYVSTRPNVQMKTPINAGWANRMGASTCR